MIHTRRPSRSAPAVSSSSAPSATSGSNQPNASAFCSGTKSSPTVPRIVPASSRKTARWPGTGIGVLPPSSVVHMGRSETVQSRPASLIASATDGALSRTWPSPCQGATPTENMV